MTTVCTTVLVATTFSSDFSLDLLSLPLVEAAVSVGTAAVEEVVVVEVPLPDELLPEDELVLVDVLLLEAVEVDDVGLVVCAALAGLT